jgi:hypothetical protein
LGRKEIDDIIPAANCKNGSTPNKGNTNGPDLPKIPDKNGKLPTDTGYQDTTCDPCCCPREVRVINTCCPECVEVYLEDTLDQNEVPYLPGAYPGTATNPTGSDRYPPTYEGLTAPNKKVSPYNDGWEAEPPSSTAPWNPASGQPFYVAPKDINCMWKCLGVVPDGKAANCTGQKQTAPGRMPWWDQSCLGLQQLGDCRKFPGPTFDGVAKPCDDCSSWSGFVGEHTCKNGNQIRNCKGECVNNPFTTTTPPTTKFICENFNCPEFNCGLEGNGSSTSRCSILEIDGKRTYYGTWCDPAIYGDCLQNSTKSTNPPYFEEEDDRPFGPGGNGNNCEHLCTGSESIPVILDCTGECKPAKQLLDPNERKSSSPPIKGKDSSGQEQTYPTLVGECHESCNCPRFNYCQGKCDYNDDSDGNPPTGNRNRSPSKQPTDPFKSTLAPDYPLDSTQPAVSEIESIHRVVNRKIIITLPDGTIIEQCLPILDDNSVSNYPPCN